MKSYFALISLLLLVGCAKKPQSLEQQIDTLLSDDIRQLEAQLIDIPFPLESEQSKKEVNNEDNGDGVMITCTSSRTSEELISYYDQEMERLGWNKIACFEGTEILLMYDKPYRWCMLSIRTLSSSKKQLVLTTKDKMQDYLS